MMTAHIHIWVESIPGDRLFLIYDLSVIEGYEGRLKIFLFGAVILLSSLALGAGLAGTKWIMKPLKHLSNQVEDLPPGETKFEPPQADDPDLAPLIQAINSLRAKNLQLVERERQFTKIVSHELRNPLASLNAAIELFRLRVQNPALDEPINRAERASQRITNMVTTLLEFSRSSSTFHGKAEAASVLADVLDQLKDSVPNIEELDSKIQGTVQIAIQPTLLAIILSNLIKNAFLHRASGAVTLLIDDKQILIRNNIDKNLSREEFSPDRLGIGIVELLCERQAWSFQYEAQHHQFSAHVLFSG